VRCVEAVVCYLTEGTKDTENNGARDDVGASTGQGGDSAAGESTCYSAYIGFLPGRDFMIRSTFENDGSSS